MTHESTDQKSERANGTTSAMVKVDCSIGCTGHNRWSRIEAHSMLLVILLVLTACGSSGGEKAHEQPAPQSQTQSSVRSACDVLTGEDVSAILAQKLQARPDLEDQGPRHSSCGYYPAEGYGVLYLTVYWRGGQQEWDTWQMATQYAGKTWEQIEKVDSNQITGASLVNGLGDRAYFGGILPSLVLKDDILLEFKLPLVTDEKRNFPLLAQAALARLQ
ncbi:MAG: hypothetical protein AB1898_19725 [Acidobacteriota bacterium]